MHKCIYTVTQRYTYVYIGCRSPPRWDASGSQKGFVKYLCRIWELALKAIQSLSCPSKHVCPAPAWLDPGTGQGCPAQLPQPRNGTFPTLAGARRTLARVKEVTERSPGEGAVPGSRPACLEQLVCVCVCFWVLGMCYQRPPKPAKAPDPSPGCAGHGAVSLALFHCPMFELVSLRDSNWFTVRSKALIYNSNSDLEASHVKHLSQETTSGWCCHVCTCNLKDVHIPF